MNYAEHPAPESLQDLVKVFWSLDTGPGGKAWIHHRAVPDGCVEIIRRLDGRSRWKSEQPERFAVGLIERPSTFSIGRGSRFVAVRIWPWTWRLLSDRPLAALRGGWWPGAEPTLLALADRLDDPAAAADFLRQRLAKAPARLREIGRAILAAAQVDDIRPGAGLEPRALQRWFAAHVGLPPRLYLRLLRFERAFVDLPGRPSLAEHALASGFADQPHMNRDFRALAGAPPAEARRVAKGPFLPDGATGGQAAGRRNR